MSGIADYLESVSAQIAETAELLRRQEQQLADLRLEIQRLRAGGGAAGVAVAPDTAAVRYPPSVRSIEVVEREMTDDEAKSFGVLDGSCNAA